MVTEFTVYYNCYKQPLFNYALKLSGDRMRSEDIIQNVFLRFFEKLPGIDSKESIRFWLFKSVRNEIYMYFRSKKVRVDQFNVKDIEDLSCSSPENVELQYELQNLKEILQNELNTLPVEQKDIFLLKEFGGFSYKEIADIHQIDEELVKSRLYKARTKIIKRMNLLAEN